MTDETTDFSNLPLSQRAGHKSWKARCSAYTELEKTFSLIEHEQQFIKYIDYLKPMVQDSNQSAQELGLASVLSFLNNAPSSVSIKHSRNLLVPTIVEKCFGANRAGTKSLALEILYKYIELDSPETNAILKESWDHKTPKNVMLGIHAIKEIINLYGIPVIDVKPILKLMPRVFDHKDAHVRQQATELTMEIYRWMGPSLSSCLGSIKPIQMKEMNDLFASSSSLAGEAKPQRYLASHNPSHSPDMGKKSLTQETLVGEDQSMQIPTSVIQDSIDPMEYMESYNILNHLPKNFYQDLTSNKWKERKETLEALKSELESHPKLENGKFHELISCLGKRASEDSNILVVILSSNCIQLIAQGLRRDFNSFKSLVVSSLIERLKEKKSTVVDALKSTLDVIFANERNVNEFISDYINALSHKNPQVRSEGILWLIRCLKSSQKSFGKVELKSIVLILLKTIEDGLDVIRDSSAECLGILMSSCTRKAVLPFLEKLDKLKMAKVEEYSTALPSSSTLTNSLPSTKNTLPTKSSCLPSTKNNLFSKTTSKSTSKTTSKTKSLSNPKSKVVNPNSCTTTTTTSSSSKTSCKDLVKHEYTIESAMDAMNLMNSSILDLLADGNWKNRLQGCNEMMELCKSNDTIQAEMVIKCLLNKPGWKESNFQILSSMLSIIEYLSKGQTFNFACASSCIPGIFEKIGDIKVKKAASVCLSSIVEATNLQFVLQEGYPFIYSIKNPKALIETLAWIKETISDFGLQGVVLSLIVEFIKKSLLNSNQTVRSTAISTLGMIKRHGKDQDISCFLQDLNPQLSLLIESEFNSNVGAPTPPKKKQNFTFSSETSTPTQVLQTKVQPPIQTQENRVDISDKLLLIQELLGNSSWKLRKEGLDETLILLKSTNYSVKPVSGDFIVLIKARLSDSNKNLIIQTLQVVGLLGKSLGKSFPFKLLLSSVCGCLSDPKPQLRSATLECLDHIYQAIGLEPMLSTLGSSLLVDQPLLRRDLLIWMTKNMSLENLDVDYQPLLISILNCLQDRNADVRKAAGVVFNVIGESLGVQVVLEKAKENFKGSQLSSLTPFIESLSNSTSKISSKISSESLNVSTQDFTKESTKESVKLKSKNKEREREKEKENIKKSSSCPNLNSQGLKQEPIFLQTIEFKSKESRSNQEKGILKWSFESPRRDLIEHLHDQLSCILSPQVFTLLASQDHYKERDYMTGIQLLDEALVSKEFNSSFLSISDLLFKYMTLRFFDNNTTLLIKVLEFLDHLISCMDDEGYCLSDFEANVFMPFWVNKMGERQETMRIKIRCITKRLVRVYPASKLFHFIIKGIESKNSKVRSECLDECTWLLQRNGSSICSLGKVLPLIATQVSDRDSTVRNAALGFIVEAWNLSGESIHKLIGPISDKDRSLIEERLKRLSVNKEKMIPDVKESMDPIKRLDSAPLLDPKSHSSPKLKAVKLQDSKPIKKEFSLDLEKLESLSIHKDTIKVNVNQEESITMINKLNSLNSLDPTASVITLKKLEEYLSRYNPDSPESLININTLVQALLLQQQILFNSAQILTNTGSRLGKHLLNALVLIFTNPQLCCHLDRVVLTQVTSEVLNRLLDPSLVTFEQGPQLSKMLNILMVRMLLNCNPNLVFGILIEILGSSAQELSNKNTMEANQDSKHTELVMKCIWKLIKSISSLLNDKKLDPYVLLKDVQDFLVLYPPLEWKRRIALRILQTDMPLRTIKTILSMLVSSVGKDLLDFSGLIPNGHLYQYLQQMLESSSSSSKKSVVSTCTVSVTDMSSSTTMSASATITNTMANNISSTCNKVKQKEKSQLANELNQIFEKILNKNLTKLGLEELYNFKSTYPFALDMIEDKLNSTGAYFQGYIRRGLAHLEEPKENNELPCEKKSLPDSSLNIMANQNVDRSLAVQALKERLAKMKLNMSCSS